MDKTSHNENTQKRDHGKDDQIDLKDNVIYLKTIKNSSTWSKRSVISKIKDLTETENMPMDYDQAIKSIFDVKKDRNSDSSSQDSNLSYDTLFKKEQSKKLLSIIKKSREAKKTRAHSNRQLLENLTEETLFTIRKCNDDININFLENSRYLNDVLINLINNYKDPPNRKNNLI